MKKEFPSLKEENQQLFHPYLALLYLAYLVDCFELSRVERGKTFSFSKYYCDLCLSLAVGAAVSSKGAVPSALSFVLNSFQTGIRNRLQS